MWVLWIVVALVVALLIAAAISDLYWRRRGFRTEIRGRGRSRTKMRIRIDPTRPFPQDRNLVDQDWVRQRDLDEPDH